MYRARHSRGCLSFSPFDIALGFKSLRNRPLDGVHIRHVFSTRTQLPREVHRQRNRRRDSEDGPPIRHGAADRHSTASGLPFTLALRKAGSLAKLELSKAPIIEYLEKENRSFNATFDDYRSSMICKQAAPRLGVGSTSDLSEETLREEYRRKGWDGLLAKIKYGFYGYVSSLRFTKEEMINQQTLADLRYPAEWYSETRKIQRKVHLHVGPTNSGKTYHALKSLEAADKGMYAGPLRLLAHEVYSRINAKGRLCALITGEERRFPDGLATLDANIITSCTVEMVGLTNLYDVAVIDEIQMLGNEERGWAWTQALLGVRAHELHLCGESRTVPLVKQLCAISGDELFVHNYDRLTRLEMDEKSLNGNLGALRKGDCIVSFSVMGIHALRKAIAAKTGRKVAIVYGGLPPETRAQQARLFNDPNNDYDFLVASDAIGMGLNLSIKRIIFETTVKFDGERSRPIDLASIKQIAGRAGRYKSAQDDAVKAESEQDLSALKGESAEDVNLVAEQGPVEETPVFASPLMPPPKISLFETAVKSGAIRPVVSTDQSSTGLVTTLHPEDFPIVQAALKQEPPPIQSSGIFPPSFLVDRFAQCFPPGTPFSYVLLRLHEISQLNHRFHLCGLRDSLWIADLIEPVREMSIQDRMIFLNAPAGFSDKKHFEQLLPELARAVKNQSGGALYEVMSIPLETLEEEVTMTRNYLRRLETLHKSVVLYLWLSFRFAGIFHTRALADEVKRRVEERIETVLAGLSVRVKRRSAAALEGEVSKEIDAEESGLQEVDGHEEHLLDGEADEGNENVARQSA